jgi:hypothetical protein
MKWHLLAAGSAVILTFAPSAHAARLITAQFDVDGEQVLETYYSDDGYPTAHEVLWYLATPPNMVGDDTVKVTPLADNPLAAELTGDVVVTLRNGRGLFMTDKLRLIRDSAEEDRWYLPRDEVQRVETQIPPTPKAQRPSSTGLFTRIGVIGGVVVVLLLALAAVVMFSPGERQRE